MIEASLILEKSSLAVVMEYSPQLIGHMEVARNLNFASGESGNSEKWCSKTGVRRSLSDPRFGSGKSVSCSQCLRYALLEVRFVIRELAILHNVFLAEVEESHLQLLNYEDIAVGLDLQSKIAVDTAVKKVGQKSWILRRLSVHIR